MREADAETQRRILNRLKRARGQLDAVIRQVESEASCRDVVTQLSAVSTALDRAGFAIVSSAMRYCVQSPEDAPARSEDGEADGRADEHLTLEELEKLFMTLA